MYVYIYIYIYMNVYIYIYIYMRCPCRESPPLQAAGLRGAARVEMRVGDALDTTPLFRSH